ncbi:glycosyltransferase family 4 protein [Herbiconiux sp. CPCC 205716]|uniref:Glycosyltransferase family 4 protein n=1 Tax=Herbiconiux gentiana TaxID=2970912 RepID=A0ABT2GIG9_9MICO|nr:glycosyltransferase family 4 protein [Herbiconiux gentiana]MCS5716023.1 glycosyltransferase family 4 protein [Herbiconiux gentiana]
MTARLNPIRVASVPAGHPYVRSVAPGPEAAHILPDPELGRPPGQWWPPALLDPQYLFAALDGFDLLHVHFGLESVPTPQLVEALALVRAAGHPIVFTVHDLENPQLTDQALHRAQLDVMIGAADELITLTPGAAAEIEARWGRIATVVPHPRMAEHHPVVVRVPDARPRVGAHLRDLRPNIDALAVARSLAAAAGALAAAGRPVDAVLRLDERVRDRAVAAELELVVREHPAVTLERGPRQGDAALERWIAGLDVAVMPYSHGTHSGWAELCWDLGAVVVDDGHGYIAEQLRDGVVVAGSGEAPEAVLDRALPLATAPGSPERSAVVAERRARREAERAAIAEAHSAVYHRALRSSVHN